MGARLLTVRGGSSAHGLGTLTEVRGFQHAHIQRETHPHRYRTKTDVNVWCSGKLPGKERPKRPRLRLHSSETKFHFRGSVTSAAGCLPPPLLHFQDTCVHVNNSLEPLPAPCRLSLPDRWLTERTRSSFKQTKCSGGICFSLQD